MKYLSKCMSFGRGLGNSDIFSRSRMISYFGCLSSFLRYSVSAMKDGYFFTLLKLHLSFSGVRDCLLFQLPIIKRLPFEIQMVVQLLSLFIIAHIYRSVFLLLMDELSQAVALKRQVK